MSTAIAQDNSPLSLQAIKKAIKANLGSPGNNQNAATTLGGIRFFAENAKGECVLGTVLPNLSPKGKVQATLSCGAEDCEETHVREQSDWHQSMRCRTHATVAKAKLTPDEKTARAVAKAKAFIAKVEGGVQAVPPTIRKAAELVPPPPAQTEEQALLTPRDEDNSEEEADEAEGVEFDEETETDNPDEE